MLLFQIFQKHLKIPGQTTRPVYKYHLEHRRHTRGLPRRSRRRASARPAVPAVTLHGPEVASGPSKATARPPGPGENELDTPDLKGLCGRVFTPVFIYLPPLQNSLREENFQQTPRFPIDKAVSLWYVKITCVSSVLNTFLPQQTGAVAT